MNLFSSRTLRAGSGLLLLSGLLTLGTMSYGQDQPSQDPKNAPDNSAKNKHQVVTADQQTNAASDLDITRRIRKSIIADKSLSMYAHNVKIITMNGMVTLKGPVKSDSEKQTLADLAAKETGGADKVTNKLSVKP